MATYIIGDVHGCFTQLQNLLTHIDYQASRDYLWFVGDIVNRGPQSLDCLRFIKHTKNCQIVLGNHDLHCIATMLGFRKASPKDTFDSINRASDKNQLVAWLIQQPFLYFHQLTQSCLVHAGLLPAWNLQQAQRYAQEVEYALRFDTENFLANLYGDMPETWSESLAGYDRLRLIVNIFTRMRYCLSAEKIHMACNLPPDQAPKGLIPWFEIDSKEANHINIFFGHWASLDCHVNKPRITALDSGCVWGKKLTAIRLEDMQRFHVKGLYQ